MKFLLMTYKVTGEHRDRMLVAVNDFIFAVREKEPDVLRYEVFADTDGVTIRHFIVFKDSVARDYHSSTPHFKELSAALSEHCEVSPVFSDLTLVATNAV